MDIRAVQKSIEVLCCYARKDQLLLEELKKHLTPLKREGLITLWADTDIDAGTEWKKEIHRHLDTAQMILLLVSPDFIASEYCYSVEMQRAIKRHEHGEARVIPIILRPVAWQKTPLSKLQALPTDASPITSRKWHHQDEAFYNVAEGIRDGVEAYLAEEERVRKAAEAELAHLAEKERLRKVEEEQIRKAAEAELARLAEEERLRKIEEERVRKAAEAELPRKAPVPPTSISASLRLTPLEGGKSAGARPSASGKQPSQSTRVPLVPLPIPSVAPPSSFVPKVTALPQRFAKLASPSVPKASKLLRSPVAVVRLALLVLLLLSSGIYVVATGSLPWTLRPSSSKTSSASRTTATGTGGGVSGVVVSSPSLSPSPFSGTTQQLSGVAWSGSKFVVVGDNGTILTSPDGHVWTAQRSSLSLILHAVAWSGFNFVAVGINGTILTSPDGQTWTVQKTGTTEELYGIAWLGSEFAAVGTNGFLLTSPDGRTWTGRYSTPHQAEDLSEVAWSGSKFVAVGGGTILTSPDGQTWMTQNITDSLNAVVWSGSKFVAVGRDETNNLNGIILSSPDGQTWTTQKIGTTQELNAVVWAGSKFVAVGRGGTILTSPDGQTWTTQKTGIINDLYGVTWAGSKFVVVGDNGTICHFPDNLANFSQITCQ